MLAALVFIAVMCASCVNLTKYMRAMEVDRYYHNGPAMLGVRASYRNGELEWYTA